MDRNIILEFVGTAIMILFGGGVCANNSLKKTFAQGTGWVLISFGWGFAVFVGAFIAAPSGAHLNPAVTIGLALAGQFQGNILGYILAQLTGAMLGAAVVYLMYKKHFDETEDVGAKKSVFCTGPAIRSYGYNLINETVGTFVLILGILMVAGAGIAGPLPVALLVVAIGMSLGGTTGYAINPARDLGPRIVHFLLPIKGKGSSDWAYSWVPIVGPIIGSCLAVGVFMLIK